MNNSPLTIYHCLDATFWLQSQCHRCQVHFTKADYQTQNYQLTFLAATAREKNLLSTVVQLTHKSCCSGCLNYLQDLYQKNVQTP